MFVTRPVLNKLYLYSLKGVYHLFSLISSLIIYLRWRLYKYDLTNHEIINSVVPGDDVYMGTNGDGQLLTAVHIKKSNKIYRLSLKNGTFLDCADDHLVQCASGYLKPVIDLKRNERVLTKYGSVQVRSVKPLGFSEFMFDTTIASGDKLYYTNDIVSHNSIITAVFIVWYILFHVERNILITSQNGDKVKELMDKINVIIRELDFYMKPGYLLNNVMTKTFDNGCKLVAQTTTENSGAGFTAHVLYCDEFALVNENYIREFYRTVYPTLTSSKISRMIITSTPRGLNKFYEIYNDAIHSKNIFNPIRVDWYEVEGRDEAWKQEQIVQLGSEEDFNQEFGNQFLAGNKLLFQSATLKKLKANQTKFIPHEIEMFEDLDLGIDYKDYLTWHPKFDLSNLQNDACRFVVSLDLADGNGGDYTVANFHQILPMSKNEIDSMKIYTEEKDFFKMVQVGIFRSNKVSLLDFAFVFYHLVVDLIIHENIKCILEMNHEGNYFRQLTETAYGDDNLLESEHLYVRFKYNMNDEQSEAYRTGLRQTSGTKDHSMKVIKDKVKYNQLHIIEHMTIEEGLSFARNKKGEYESQTGNDDCILTELNICHHMDTVDYVEQIDELMDFVPEAFLKEIDAKLKRNDNQSLAARRRRAEYEDEGEGDIEDLY